MTKSAEGVPAGVGDEVTFVLTVINNSNQNLENVTLTDPILSFFDILQATTTKGRASVDADENVITVTIANLEPGEVVTITIVVEVNDTTDFTAEVPNTADLAYDIDGVTQSEASNTVCFMIEGASERRFDGLRSPSSLGILSFGLLAILFCGYGIWRQSREEQDGRRYIIVGVVLLLLAIVLYVALVFLPSQAALRGPRFPECAIAVRSPVLPAVLDLPTMFAWSVNAERESLLLQRVGDRSKRL